MLIYIWSKNNEFRDTSFDLEVFYIFVIENA